MLCDRWGALRLRYRVRAQSIDNEGASHLRQAERTRARTTPIAQGWMVAPPPSALMAVRWCDVYTGPRTGHAPWTREGLPCPRMRKAFARHRMEA